MEAHKRIGDYEILEELGRGGMGRVYKVRNTISDRVEAMKVLLPDLVGRQDLAARFVREIKTLAALHHPNIASLRTAMTADNQLVMIMEFVEGESLAHRLRRGPLQRDEALSYIGQALAALDYAHAQGVVHRDIKPANMMLTPQGVVKLTDFGIARSRNDQTLTVAGTTTGSLSYMSPEQVNGEETDARSDLYSLGISLYELVTGERPFRADSDFGVMVAHLKEMPRPPIELQPGLGPELNAVILKSIAKSPADRFQSAAEFGAALNTLQPAGQPAVVAPSTVIGNAAAAPTQIIGQRPVVAAAAAAATPLRPETMSIPTGSGRVTPPSVPAAAVVPPVPGPVTKQGHPALYVVLGGVLVLSALVGAGLYIGSADARPSGATESANPAAAVSPSTPAPAAATPSEAAAPSLPAPTAAPLPAATPDATPGAATAGTSSAAPTASAPTGTSSPAAASSSTMTAAPTAAAAGTVAGAAANARANDRNTASRRPAPPAAPAAPAAPRARDSEAATPPAAAQPAAALDLEDLETSVDQLTARAAAVDTSLTTMQRQQAAQGFNMRGDVLERQVAMRTNLKLAQDAIAAGNAARAKRYIDLLEGNISFLERFLGR
jgi:serine/threonine-protein kinase